MRTVLRSLLISYVSVMAAQRIVGGFEFGGKEVSTMFLIIVALALLNMLMIPVFKIISLPHSGIAFMFLSFILTLVTFYVLTLFIPEFSVASTTLAKLRIFGFVLPSRDLDTTWSMVYSALTVGIVYHVLEWICGKR